MQAVRRRQLTLGQWGHIANISGVLVGLISILAIMFQLHLQNKIMRAENAQKLVELAMISNMGIVNDPKLASLWSKGNEDYNSLSAEDRIRFRMMWLVYFNVLESAFHQREDRLIDEEDFQSRNQCLIVNRSAVAEIWPELSQFYPARFQRHVTRVIGTKR